MQIFNINLFKQITDRNFSAEIANLERLISISNMVTIKFEDQFLIPRFTTHSSDFCPVWTEKLKLFKKCNLTLNNLKLFTCSLYCDSTFILFKFVEINHLENITECTAAMDVLASLKDQLGDESSTRVHVS